MSFVKAAERPEGNMAMVDPSHLERLEKLEEARMVRMDGEDGEGSRRRIMVNQ
jgi:hypothetical protein